MRVLISADMEGVSGVVHPDDVEPGTAEYAEFRHVMTADVNAAVAGFFDAGATDVVVNDSHYTMRNLVVTELDPRVRYIRGSQKPLGMLEGLLADGHASVDVLAFVGYHAAAGQPGILAHTHMGNSIVEVRFAGTPMSEGRLNAAAAAEAGVPLVLVTGDDVTCADARAYAPGVSTAQVKRAITRYTGEVLPPAVAQQLIRTQAQAGLSAPAPVAAVAAPYRIEIDVFAEHLAVAASRVPDSTRTGPRTVAVEAATMLEAYLRFRLATVLIGSAVVGDWG
ncbi:MAG: M55 family metallopeptidase [Actinomycetes bacterium]